MQTLDDDNLEKLRTSQRGSECISNIINYDILNNFRYSDDFFFSHLDHRIENENNEIHHKTYDAVVSALKIGEKTYVKDKKVHAKSIWTHIAFNT